MKTMNPKSVAKRLLAEHLHPDTLGTNKAGNLLLRWEFFYTHGRTAEQCAQAVTRVLSRVGLAATVVAQRQVWKEFRGGASVAHQRHFYVEVALTQ